MDSAERQSAALGRDADRPTDIPKAGWKEILKRTFKGLSQDNIAFIAAGVAFYAFLSIPALLTALVSIYGLVADPSQVGLQVASLRGFVPEEALGIISDQLTRVTSQTGRALTFALLGSVLFALWSGANSVKALITALNIANDESEKRSFLKLNVVALLLTLGGIVMAAITIGLVVAVTAIIGSLPIPEALKNVILIGRWPALAIAALLGIAAIYRYGPSREEPKWRWVSWGASLAMALWIGASALFSWYVSSFGNYNKTYGSLGAIVVLLMWFYISTFVVLMGAKLNAEIEHQTATDSTTGDPQPMGERGAKMADTLGDAA